MGSAREKGYGLVSYGWLLTFITVIVTLLSAVYGDGTALQSSGGRKMPAKRKRCVSKDQKSTMCIVTEPIQPRTAN